MKYVLRPTARAELAGIWSYTAQRWGVVQADGYIDEIVRRIEFATEFPGIGSEATGLPPQYRKLNAGSHRVIYRCIEDELIVVRVIHEREDVPTGVDDL